MTQAIAGVSPNSVSERTVMIVWPSNAATVSGRFLGRRYDNRWPTPNNKIFWLGNLWVILSFPWAMLLYLGNVIPIFGIGKRYRLTNRRVIVERGLGSREEKSIALDSFDSVSIDVRAGQAWYHAGDLVFRKGDTVVFRLEGVSRPEAFRQTVVKSHMSYVGVQKAMAG